MSKTSETGHAKNTENFEILISSVTGYGAAYHPTRAAITLGNMHNQLKNAKDAITNINSVLPLYSKAVALREIAFMPLAKLSTKIFNWLKAAGIQKQILDNAQTNHRKITGTRASVKLSEEEKETLLAEGTIVNQVSASQLGYNNRLDNLEKQIQLLLTIPEYIPNETELKIVTLTTLYNNLKAKNASVVTHATPLYNSRVARNEIMYNKETGMVAIALDVKNYVRSVFGSASPQYKQISGLAFKQLKI
ncbi:hypothetical protein GM921_04940 [Pedobacter sp. LMG 31464]|uniref:Uncharacterized protein n=1 Tax=Pedobacter planticolens TaxID=2679964 RepID=A0A923DXW7_9SPHI|nr:hypothetical protein [Pedobacter planticolens]MBB2144818.1 hypothetical protein [Pedobacter planticolens]